jgi:hypothetical protein
MAIDPRKLAQTAADAQRRAADARAQSAAREAATEAAKKAADAAKFEEVRASKSRRTSESLPYKVEQALGDAAYAGLTSASVEVHRGSGWSNYDDAGLHAGALDAAKAEAARLNNIPGVTAEVTDTKEQVTRTYSTRGIGESGTSGSQDRSYETTERVVKINVRVRRP